MSECWWDEEVEFELLDPFREFSFKHIALGDVDPIYTMVRNSALNYDEKKRFIFSHLMVYDLKSSIALSDIKDNNEYYRDLLRCFTESKVGKDRKDVASRETNINSRTYGTQFPKIIVKSPEDWIEQAIQRTSASLSWNESLIASKNIPTFGEYFSFKLADMIETVFDIPNYNVVWDEYFRKSLPRGSLTGYEMVRTGSNHKFRDKSEIRNCSLMEKFYLSELEFFKNYTCPQTPNRTIGVQEIETLLCDYRKMRKNTLKHGDKVLKLQEGIDHNKTLDTALKLFVGAKPLLEKRVELLELGIKNINESHCSKRTIES